MSTKDEPMECEDEDAVVRRPSVATAIREARSEVQMIRWGNHWEVLTWSESHEAWLGSDHTDYYRARSISSTSVVISALMMLGMEREDAVDNAELFRTGSIESRVRAAIFKLKLA